MISASDPARHQVLQSTAAKRLNIGCGQHPLLYWTNLDAATDALADLHVSVPPLPMADNSLEEIYAGHFLEHLTPGDADVFLQECFRCLVPGGRVGILVPDTREIMTRYLRGMIDEIEFPIGTWHPISDINTLNKLFLYSTVQESSHKWCYDTRSLRDLLTKHGFDVRRPIDRYRDPRVSVGAWYQCGWDARKPGA